MTVIAIGCVFVLHGCSPETHRQVVRYHHRSKDFQGARGDIVHIRPHNVEIILRRLRLAFYLESYGSVKLSFTLSLTVGSMWSLNTQDSEDSSSVFLPRPDGGDYCLINGHLK
jgi:predicted metalloprotease